MDGATIQCSQLQDEIKCLACPEENRDRRSMLENGVQQAHTYGVCVCLFLWAFRAFAPIINIHTEFVQIEKW